MREKLVALYPFTNVMTLTGFLAAVLLLLGLDPLIAATISLWFCLIGMLTIYLIGKKSLKLLDLQRFVLYFLMLLCFITILLTVVVMMPY